MGSIYCTNCGKVNDTSFNVCYNCGTRIHKPVPDTENASVPGTPDNDIQRLDKPYAAMNHRKQYLGDYLKATRCRALRLAAFFFVKLWNIRFFTEKLLS